MYGVARWLPYLTSALLFAAALVGAFVSGVDVVALVDDPLAAAGMAEERPWVGLISVCGSLLWSMGAGVWALSAMTCARVRRERIFAVATAWMTLLAFDDALMFHDHLVPRAVGVADAEKLVLGLYVICVAGWGAAFSREIRRGPIFPLALAASSFATSLVLDLVHSQRYGLVVTEDAAKVYGIVMLLCWSILSCSRMINARTEPAADVDRARMSPHPFWAPPTARSLLVRLKTQGARPRPTRQPRVGPSGRRSFDACLTPNRG